MKPTIEAKIGYRVRNVRNVITGQKGICVYDGEEPIFVAKKKSVEEFKDEARQNEAFELCEVFITTKGNTFAYWRDNEIDADYITKISN